MLILLCGTNYYWACPDSYGVSSLQIDRSRWFNYREVIEFGASSTFGSVCSSTSPLVTHQPNHTMYCGDRTKDDAIAGSKFDVMGVACCSTDPGKIASCGDDGRVLLWRYKAAEQ